MARVDLIRRAIIDLIEDLDTLARRVGAGDVPFDAARRVVSNARGARDHLDQQLGQIPDDFDHDDLLDWLNEVREKVGRARGDVARAPDAVSDYIEKLRVWAATLPGDGTTPPP
jgi:hypothetical protein